MQPGQQSPEDVGQQPTPPRASFEAVVGVVTSDSWGFLSGMKHHFTLEANLLSWEVERQEEENILGSKISKALE